MKIIGVTGGIGAGKSSVTRILARLGAYVIDADQIARDVVQKGKPAYYEIVEAFGEGILDPERKIDRSKLGEQVFQDKSSLNILNDITHKYIIENIKENISEFESSGKYPMLVLEAAIPVKHGFLDMVHEVWVVTAAGEVRIKRIMDRNGFDYDEALNRILSQKSEEEYLKVADRILSNNTDISELEKNVLKFLESG
ncbi:MAG: dephospho-CoA kinase [Clostridia bacterium]|nr:dephospho-CoA kinase [Clostridia bacterium]